MASLLRGNFKKRYNVYFYDADWEEFLHRRRNLVTRDEMLSLVAAFDANLPMTVPPVLLDTGPMPIPSHMAVEVEYV